MQEQPVSLQDLIRNPVAWLCAGGLALGLFVLFPTIPASLEVAALCALIVLLGAAVNQEARPEAQQDQARPGWSTPDSRLAVHFSRLEEQPVSCGRRRLYVGPQLADRPSTKN